MISKRRTVARAALVAVVAATAGAVAVAVPVRADVSVSPAQARQGEAVRLTIRVSNDSSRATLTKVELYLPEATPVAEVFPLSVPDWAPKITMRRLAQPLEAIHGSRTTEVPAQLTWIAAPGRATGPGRTAELPIELGPLPETAQLALTVVQTYSDGTAVRWGDQPATGGAAGHPAPVLTLLPAAAGGQAHGDHATGTDTDPAGDGAGRDGAQQAAGNSTDNRGTALALLISGLVVGLLVGVGLGGFAVVRARRAPALTVPAGTLDPAGVPDAPAPAGTTGTTSPAGLTGTAAPRS